MIPEFIGLSLNEQQILDRFIQETTARSLVFSRSKTKDVIYTLTYPSHKKILAKLTQTKQGQCCLWLRFSASKAYSEHFNQKLIETLEEDDYRYVGCYPGCQECDPPKGYNVLTPKGTYFRCHKELINVGFLDQVPFEEALSLIDLQNRFETNQKRI